MTWYGGLIGAGMLICVVWAYFVAKKRGYYKDMVFDMAFVGILLGIFGARFYYVMTDIADGGSWTFLRFFGFNRNAPRGDRFEGFAGLAILGGVAGALAGGVLLHFREHIAHGFKKLWAKITSKPQPKFKRKPENQRATFWQMADLALMFMILGQAIGRWGNFANQEVFGIEVSRHIFPFTVSIDRTGTYHLALFFYESMWNLAGFGIMYFLYQGKRKSFDGFILAVYLIWYGIGRAAMEPLRDSRFQMGNNLINLILAIAMILIGLIIIIHHLYKARTLKMKPFIFVEQSKLTEKYLGYRQSILHHPNIYEPKAKRAADLDDEFYSEADEGFTAEDADEFYGREDGNHEVENAVEKEDSVVEKAEETKAEKAEETTPKTKEIKETKKSKPIESEDEGFSAEDAEEFFKSTETDDDGFYSVD